MTEPEDLVLALLREVRTEISELRTDVSELRTAVTGVRSSMATKDDRQSEINSLRGDVASDMVLLERRLGERISHLNRAVIEHHSSAVGHGVLYSEIEERVRRIEKHLNLAE